MSTTPAWLTVAGLLVLTAAGAILAYWLVFATLNHMGERSDGVIERSLSRNSRRPARILFPLVALLTVLPATPLPAGVETVLAHLLTLGLIAAVAWLVVASTQVVDDVLLARYRMSDKDNLVAREIQTRVVVLRNVLVIAVAVVTLAVMLMTFPAAQRLGTSLLASAGLIGLVAGLAAQPVLTNLIAGLQLALTQPIRLDDVVVIDGDWGRIEEITTTYVVVRVWDLRRLVVPLTWFIQHPVENWTRQTADLLGTVYLNVDYTVPVEPLRQELRRVLAAADGMWDGKAWGLQVTDATERTVQLRALMSAPDSSTAWALRCRVREAMIAYLQEHYPEALPRARVELGGGRPEAGQG